VDDQLGKGHLPVGAARKDDIQARKLSRGGEICKRDQNRLPGPHTAGHRHHAKSKGYRKVSKSNGDPILYSFLKLFSVHTAARSVFYFLNIAFSKPCVFKFYHPILFPSTIFSFYCYSPAQMIQSKIIEHASSSVKIPIIFRFTGRSPVRMGRFVNPRFSAFQDAVNSKIYVDKTELLEYTNSVI